MQDKESREGQRILRRLLWARGGKNEGEGNMEEGGKLKGEIGEIGAWTSKNFNWRMEGLEIRRCKCKCK